MFCRNCGSEMNENAAVCVKCGISKGEGVSYCPHCGKETNADAAVCLSCGCSLTNTFGIHNFYLGYTQKAIIQVLLGTVGALFLFIGPVVSGIWGLVEGILILTGKIAVDGKGNPLKD